MRAAVKEHPERRDPPGPPRIVTLGMKQQDQGGGETGGQRQNESLGDPARGWRPEGLMFSPGLLADAKISGADAAAAHRQPIEDEGGARLDLQGIAGPGGEATEAAEAEHDRGEGAAVKGGALHEGANGLEILGSPSWIHGPTLHHKVEPVKAAVSRGARHKRAELRRVCV